MEGAEINITFVMSYVNRNPLIFWLRKTLFLTRLSYEGNRGLLVFRNTTSLFKRFNYNVHVKDYDLTSGTTIGGRSIIVEHIY